MKINIQSIDDEAQKNWVIRKAVLDDYAAVKALQDMVFAIHRKARPDYFKSMENSYTKAEFEELLAHPCPICWLAVEGETIVGLSFGKVEETQGNSTCKSRLVVFIEDLVTLQEYWGKGIGTQLMTKAG